MRVAYLLLLIAPAGALRLMHRGRTELVRAAPSRTNVVALQEKSKSPSVPAAEQRQRSGTTNSTAASIEVRLRDALGPDGKVPLEASRDRFAQCVKEPMVSAHNEGLQTTVETAATPVPASQNMAEDEAQVTQLAMTAPTSALASAELTEAAAKDAWLARTTQTVPSWVSSVSPPASTAPAVVVPKGTIGVVTEHKSTAEEESMQDTSAAEEAVTDNKAAEEKVVMDDKAAGEEAVMEDKAVTEYNTVASSNILRADQEGALSAQLYVMNKAIIDTVKGAIDVIYAGRDFARFYVLETVARVPYFAYLSVLHLRETLGKRDPGMTDRMRVHYAEADNELHHLLIMEALGGNASALDRAFAHGMAVGYYWYVVLVYSLSPRAAYHLSELIEDHAYHTYDAFLCEHGDELKQQDVPDVARRYYEEDNPFLFDLLCTMSGCISEPAHETVRRPKLESLYDVFVNIRNDEKEHWGTLCNLVQHDSLDEVEGVRVAATQPRAPTGIPAHLPGSYRIVDGLFDHLKAVITKIHGSKD